MGGGSWTTQEHITYSTSRGRSVDSKGFCSTSYKNVQEAYTQKRIHGDLNPKKVIRECLDTPEHPNTIPVILALDVTGSMGDAAIEVSKQLGVLMSNLYGSVKDIEFCVMGIGDLAYDDSPIQMSQFESDVRIAENLDKIYFEMGGGGNDYESYTAAWYMGLNHAKIDAFDKRGNKGIIITMGDECINPHLPVGKLRTVLDSEVKAESVETPTLYNQVKNKYHIHHITVKHGAGKKYYDKCVKSFADVIGEENSHECTTSEIVELLTKIITNTVNRETLIVEDGTFTSAATDAAGEVSW